jgi:hypothetical protein
VFAILDHGEFDKQMFGQESELKFVDLFYNLDRI